MKNRQETDCQERKITKSHYGICCSTFGRCWMNDHWRGVSSSIQFHLTTAKLFSSWGRFGLVVSVLGAHKFGRFDVAVRRRTIAVRSPHQSVSGELYRGNFVGIQNVWFSPLPALFSVKRVFMRGGNGSGLFCPRMAISYQKETVDGARTT